MQDLGHKMWLQDLALIPSIMPPTPMARGISGFLNFEIKRIEFCIKTDHNLNLEAC